MLIKHLISLIVPILCCASVFCFETLDYLNKYSIERWGEFCVTKPNHKLGQCVEAHRCDYLTVIPDKLKFAKDNLCGTVSYTPLICCPLSNDDVSMHSSLPTTCLINDTLAFLMTGGENATFKSSPWLMLLSFERSSAKRKAYTCAGSLINDRYVVTAAHCLKDPDSDRQIASVHLGEWDFTFNNYTGDLSIPIDVDIETVLAHPNYRMDNRLYDIGLIRMSRSILHEYSRNMHPINLPLNYTGDGSQERGYQITGFGQTETEPTSLIKKIGHIDSVPYDECRDKYNAHGGEIQQIQLCGTSKDTDTCYGDSGGSLVAASMKDKIPCLYLMGIVSFGPSPCGTSDLPSVYTNILPFLDWISINIQD